MCAIENSWQPWGHVPCRPTAWWGLASLGLVSGHVCPRACGGGPALQTLPGMVRWLRQKAFPMEVIWRSLTEEGCWAWGSLTDEGYWMWGPLVEKVSRFGPQRRSEAADGQSCPLLDFGLLSPGVPTELHGAGPH